MSQITTGKVALILVCLLPLAAALKVGMSRDNPSPPKDPVIKAVEPEPSEDTLMFSSLNIRPIEGLKPRCPDTHIEPKNDEKSGAFRAAFLADTATSPGLIALAVETFGAACACKPAVYARDMGKRFDRLERDMRTEYQNRYIRNKTAKSPYYEHALWADINDEFADRIEGLSKRQWSDREDYASRVWREMGRRFESREAEAQCIMTLAGESIVNAPTGGSD